MREGTLFVLVGVEGGDTGYADSRGIGQVFVTFQPDGYANLCCGTNGAGIVRRGGGANHTQNPSPAPNRHALTQGNLRGHSQREFDLGALGQRSVSKEKDPARTQVLGKPDAFNGYRELAKRHGKKIRESLSDSAFNPDWRRGHDLTSFGERRKMQNNTLTQVGCQ
jgi:hypothetical protein